MPVARLLAFAALLAAVLLPGCGGSEPATDAPPERAAAEAYARSVAAASERVRTQVAVVARDGSFTDGAAAASATDRYAAAVLDGAKALDGVTAPPQLREQHAALIGLYRETATRLDELGRRFEQAGSDPTALATVAQELATAIRALATREAQLRGAIDAELARLAGVPVTTPPVVVAPQGTTPNATTPEATTPAATTP